MLNQLKKYQVKTELWLINGLQNMLDSWLFFKAFSTADSLQQFYNRGYWYGFFFLIFIGFLFLLLDYWGLYLGFLTNRGTDLPGTLKELLKQVAEIFGFNVKVPQFIRSFPIYFLIPLTYLAFNFIPPLKKKIGEWFSSFFIFIFVKAIDLGEWFINRRWLSIFTIGALTFLIALGLYYLVDQSSKRKQLGNDLNSWFVRTEGFIETSSLSENENTKYENDIKKYWNSDFENFFTSPENKISSFSILNDVLGQLYGEPSLNEEWFAHLEKIDLSEVDTNKLGKNATQEEIRAWCLVNILSGRIHNRKFEKKFNNTYVKSYPVDNPNSRDNSNVNSNSAFNSALSNLNSNIKLKINTNSKANITGNTVASVNSSINTSDNLNLNTNSDVNSNTALNTNILSNLKTAEGNFKAAERTLELVSSKETEDWVKSYRSAIKNGLGNVYSNRFNYTVLKNSLYNSENGEDISDGCKYPRDCVARAKKYYSDAAEGFNECSFQSLRKTNNIADLYVRISQNYKVYATTISLDENKTEMSRLELAGNMDKEVINLTKCLKPLIPIILVTMAQASAESANLKIYERVENGEVAAQVLNSATYLKMAYNFGNPSNLLDWELKPFCKFSKDSKTSKNMNENERAVYKKYQDSFSMALGKTNFGDLESPIKQINRRLEEICQ